MAQDLSKLIVELGQIESRINEINIGLTKTNLLLDQTGKDRLSMMNKMKYGGSGNPELDRLSAQRDATAMQLKMRGGTAWGTIAGEGPTSKEISTAFEKNYQKLVQEATAQIKANVPKVVESSPTTPVVKTIGQAFEEHYTQLVKEADAQIRASVAKATEELMARMPGTLASSGATGMQGAKLASLDQTSNRFGRYTTPYTSTGTWERFGGGGIDPFSAGPMGTGKSPIDASRNAQSVIGDINKAFTGMDSVSDKTKQHIIDDIMAEVKAFEALGQKVDVTVNKLRNMGGMPFFSADITSGGKSSTYGRGINPAGDLLDVDQMKRNQIANRLGVNPQAQEDFYRRLEEAKFNIGNVTKINTEAKSGRTVITAKQIDEVSGAVREGTFAYNKYGTAINVASRQHQGFMDSIVRNTGELIKWSIGIGLVYGTMYKLQQLITMAVENQTKLIDVNVALGDSQRDVNAIFDDASAVAEKTGESIAAVLDTYVIAYRAVGGITEPLERTAAANKLLTDATILNKLSNLEAADSVDTLAGSLRQITKPGTSAADAFKEGSVLLDKWVAVSNKANIGLGDLAMAFSVTAESAINSGMSVDQLNASIAVLSEKIGGLGGKETGNAVRAIIGGVYQQQATDILNRYGIAVKDSSDQMRSFMTISQDVYDLYRSGIISEGELNKIAYVWGGGVRRGQQVVAWMKDQERMQQITAVSANANGEAQAALSKKMDSVQTSSVKVSNAFQGLAMALGNEGGLLGGMAGLNTLLASSVDLLTKLTKLLGSVTIPAAVGLAMGLFSNFGRDTGRANQLNAPFTWLDNKISRVGSKTVSVPLSQQGGGIPETTLVYNKTMASIGSAASKYGMGLAFSFASALPRALEGGKGLEGAAYTFGGGVLGTLMAGGNPFGAIVGSAVGDAFYQKVISYKGDFAKLLEPTYINAPKPGEVAGKVLTPEEQRQAAYDAVVEAYKAARMSNPDDRSFGRGSLMSQGAALEQWFKTTFGKEPTGKIKNPNMGMAETFMSEWLQENSPEIWAKLIPQIETAGKTMPKVIAPVDTETYKYEVRLHEAFGDFFDKFTEKERANLRKKLLAGEIKPGAQYKETQESFAGIQSTAFRLYAAQNKLGTGAAANTPQSLAEMEKYSKMLAATGNEERATLNTLTSEWVDKTNEWERIKGMPLDQIMEDDGKSVRQHKEELDVLNVVINDTVDALLLLAKSAEEAALPTASLQFMKEYTASQISAAGPGSTAYQNMVNQLNATAAANGVQSPVNETASLIFPKDQTNPIFMKADWAIVQYLLGEILKTNEKQLDGIYNLPSGASFYVPFQAWKMDTETRQAMGTEGTTALDATQFDGSVSSFGGAVNQFEGIIKYYASLNPTLDKELNKKLGSEEGALKYYKSLNPELDTALENTYASSGSHWKPTTDVRTSTSPYYPSGEPKTGGLYEPSWSINPSMPGYAPPQTNIPPLNTAFTLNLNTQTQLIVDGRMLADVIKPYLQSDLLSSEGAVGSAVSITVV